MKISLFGLGHVGAVTAACLAESGHDVIAVDTDKDKVAELNRGNVLLHEMGLAELTGRMVAQDALCATLDSAKAIAESDITLICVGTPSLADGSIDLSQLQNVCQTIGHALAQKGKPHLIIVRSTILPGTMKECVIPLLEQASTLKAGSGFSICHNPEFLREGTAISDFYHPPKTVIGANDASVFAAMHELYKTIEAPFLTCTLEEAEMVKYTDNCWHAAKIAFANEIGHLCKTLGIDSHKVMHMFCQDTKLNLSPYYLRPGFAFGGSCLPKDISALIHKAELHDVASPLLHALLPSNQTQIERLTQLLIESGKHTIGFLGITFKPGTDDMRNSPIVDVIATLLERHIAVSIFDPSVTEGRLKAPHHQQTLGFIPKLASLLTTQESVIAASDVIVISQPIPDASSLLPQLKPHQLIIDLVRIAALENGHRNYYGFSW